MFSYVPQAHIQCTKKSKWTILRHQCFHMFHRLIFSVQKSQNGLYYTINVFICSIGTYSVYKKSKWTILRHQCFRMFHRLIFSVQKVKMDYTTPSMFSYVPQAHIQCTKSQNGLYYAINVFICSIGSYSVYKKAKWTILRHQCFHMFHRLRSDCAYVRGPHKTEKMQEVGLGLRCCLCRFKPKIMLDKA